MKFKLIRASEYTALEVFDEQNIIHIPVKSPSLAYDIVEAIEVATGEDSEWYPDLELEG